MKEFKVLLVIAGIVILVFISAIYFAAKYSEKQQKLDYKQEPKTEYVYKHTENADYQKTKQIEIESVGLPTSSNGLWDVMVFGTDGKTLLYKTQCKDHDVKFDSSYTQIDSGPDRVYVRGGVIIISNIERKDK